MRRHFLGWTLAALATVPSFGGGEIHGTVRTERGESFTGAIRWDVNENFWDDTLDAARRERVEPERESYKVRFFGFQLGGDDGWITHGFSIPFGDLTAVERVDGNTAELSLKNGERIRVQASGSDMGSGMRGLIVDDRERGTVEISWNMLARVEFSPGSGPGRDDQRLYGTVETASQSLTGFIVWDRDESLLEDVIDGDDGTRRREIPLRDIRIVERRGRDGSLVTLADGTRLAMTGTNDVDDGHRGVAVTVPGVGAANVPWKRVVRVTFATAPASPSYESFDGGRKLHGIVRTGAGAALEGTIVWDRDERWNWETLDGENDGISWSVPFASIESIASVHDHAEVRLRGGRLLVLEGTNDVNSENKGIVVTAADGGETLLAWDEVATVTFD